MITPDCSYFHYYYYFSSSKIIVAPDGKSKGRMEGFFDLFGLMGVVAWILHMKKSWFVFASKKKVHKEPQCARFISLPIIYARECIALTSAGI